MTIDELIAFIRQLPDAEHGLGASDLAISQAERALEVTIPLEYKEFLAGVGWLRFQNLEIFGLGDDVPADFELVGLTEAERTELLPYLPRTLLPLSSDGSRSYYCIDTASAGRSQVVFWDSEQDQAEPPDAVDRFTDWLYGELSYRLE